jgi:peroxiredoxin/ribosomal protein S17
MTEAKTSLKRTLIGKVVSDKRAKTVTVLVERYVKHELYDKIVVKSSKYHAHDERSEYKLGDVLKSLKAVPCPEPRIGLRPDWFKRQQLSDRSAESKKDQATENQSLFFRYLQEPCMLKVGDTLPSVTLMEAFWPEEGACSMPQPVQTKDALAGKTVVVFAVPGAYTPTCSAKHLPGYVEHANALKAKGVDEIWCVSVNDAFVMAAWGRDQQVGESVRMLADGSADLAQATGLVLDLTAKGMGVRSARYSALLVNGVVRVLNVEAAGQFEVSDATTILGQLDEIKQ